MTCIECVCVCVVCVCFSIMSSWSVECTTLFDSVWYEDLPAILVLSVLSVLGTGSVIPCFFRHVWKQAMLVTFRLEQFAIVRGRQP